MLFANSSYQCTVRGVQCFSIFNFQTIAIITKVETRYNSYVQRSQASREN